MSDDLDSRLSALERQLAFYKGAFCIATIAIFAWLAVSSFHEVPREISKQLHQAYGTGIGQQLSEIANASDKVEAIRISTLNALHGRSIALRSDGDPRKQYLNVTPIPPIESNHQGAQVGLGTGVGPIESFTFEFVGGPQQVASLPSSPLTKGDESRGNFLPYLSYAVIMAIAILGIVWWNRRTVKAEAKPGLAPEPTKPAKTAAKTASKRKS